MAENPLITLGRVFGGIVLMQGNLGHQVLGQLLVANTNEVAIAGAFLVFAGTSGQKSAVGQMALRTVAPALAVRALINKQENRLERTEARIARRERDLHKRRARQTTTRLLQSRNRELRDEVSRLSAIVAGSPAHTGISSPPDLPFSSPPLMSLTSPPGGPPQGASALVAPPAAPFEPVAAATPPPAAPAGAPRRRTNVRSGPRRSSGPKKPASRKGSRKR